MKLWRRSPGARRSDHNLGRAVRLAIGAALVAFVLVEAHDPPSMACAAAASSPASAVRPAGAATSNAAPAAQTAPASKADSSAKAAPAPATAAAPAPAPAASEPALQGAAKAVHPKPAELAKLAAANPLEFLRAALNWSDDKVTDYTCRFQKQEKIGNELRKTETMQMKFRANVFGIYLKWIEEPSKGQEVIYVAGQNKNQAVVHPAGFLGILFRKVLLDPQGKTAMKHSRRPVTMAGMANMIRLIVDQCDAAKANGDLTLTFEGIRMESGRPTYVFERVLPQKNDYPCPILMIFIDQQYLAGTDQIFANAADGRGLLVKALASFKVVAQVLEMGGLVVGVYEHRLCVKETAHLVAHQVVLGLHVKLLGQALLDAVDHLQLGAPLLRLS